MQTFVIINNAELDIHEFTSPLEKIVKTMGLKSITIEYKDCLHFNFDKIHGIILSGSPQGNDIVENHLPYFNWIKNCNTPILGICAGHHITGFLYGSEILRSTEPESGDFEVETILEDHIFKGMPKFFKVKQMHNDSITLPKNFNLLATSETCKNQFMKHKSKLLYTCQFHPEYYNHKLIRNFIYLCI